MGGGGEGVEYQVGNLFENLVVHKVTDETLSQQQLLFTYFFSRPCNSLPDWPLFASLSFPF